MVWYTIAMHSDLNTALQDFCNRLLRIGLQNKWDGHLVEPVHTHTATFARLFMQRALFAEVQDAASNIEGALLVCGAAQVASVSDVNSLVEELHTLVEAYEQSREDML
jgi:hypothetical protein